MKKQFEKITLAQVFCLCRTIEESKVRQKSYIKRKYSDIALHFDETLSLFEKLNIIKNDSDELIFATNFSFPNSIEDFKKYFLQKIFSADKNITKCINEFLLNFKIEANGIVFNATPKDKIKFSDTRNLLLELEFIFVTSDNNCYVVNNNYSDLFHKVINHNNISLATFKNNQNAKDEIGLAAEKAIIDFEIRRLTKISLRRNEIEHTSQENVYAGYDIKSYENYLDDNSNKIVRYIEVKAVSISDFKFYWSKHEIEKSKIFGERYFLYLLPVKDNHSFDFDNLLMVSNPFKNVYSNQHEWKKDWETICLHKKANK